MNTIKKISAILAVVTISANAAMDHSAHRGGGSEASGGNCVRPTLSKMQPAHLSTVSPSSEFSFVVSNLENPEQVSVQVKNKTVNVTSEFKDPYYIIRGKIPAELRNTAARVDVKVDAKTASCRAAEGWLLKISE